MGDVRVADGRQGGSDEAEEDVMAYLGAFPAKVKMVEDAAEETLLLWAFQDPVRAKQNAFVSQGSLQLKLDACGQLLHIMQAPSSVVIFVFLVTLETFSAFCTWECSQWVGLDYVSKKVWWISLFEIQGHGGLFAMLSRTRSG